MDRLSHVEGFDWDEGTIEKNWEKHHVSYVECEEVFLSRPLLVAEDGRYSKDEVRRLMENKGRKDLLRFRDEKEESKLWASHDSTEYVDYFKAKSVIFENLRPSTRTISIRLPESLIAHLKALAKRRDVPYQSLLKIFLTEKVEEELRSPAKVRSKSAVFSTGLASRRIIVAGMA
jgi:predicted DNA binding CopG/RHH family protein